MGTETSVVPLDTVFSTSLCYLHLGKSVCHSAATDTSSSIMELVVTSWPGLGCDNSIVLTLVSISHDSFLDVSCLSGHDINCRE